MSDIKDEINSQTRNVNEMSLKYDDYEHKSKYTKSVENLNNKLPSTLNECTLNHLLSIIKYHESFNDKIINPFKTQIMTFLQEKQANGSTIIRTKRKQFSENLIRYIGNNKKIRGAGNKTWDKLKYFQFDLIPEEKNEFASSINDTLPWTLDQCETNQLISIITKHTIFDDKTINPFKNKITSYIIENAVNGKKISNTTIQEINKMLVKYAKNKNIEDASNKTWSILRKYPYLMFHKPDLNIPLHRYSVVNVCDTLQWWLFNDKSHQQKLETFQNIFDQCSLDGAELVRISSKETRKILDGSDWKDKPDDIMTIQTVNILLHHLDELKKTDPIDLKYKTAKYIAYILYYHPMIRLLSYIRENAISGQKLLDILQESNANVFRSITGWNEHELQQIQLLFYQYVSLTKKQFIKNMNTVFNDNVESIQQQTKDKIRDLLVVEETDVERIYFCIKNAYDIEDFSDDIISIVEQLKENNNKHETYTKMKFYVEMSMSRMQFMKHLETLFANNSNTSTHKQIQDKIKLLLMDEKMDIDRVSGPQTEDGTAEASDINIHRVYKVIAQCFTYKPDEMIPNNSLTMAMISWKCNYCSNANFPQIQGGITDYNVSICKLCGMDQISSIILKIKKDHSFISLYETKKKGIEIY